jgi:prepilin-type processing-associated H-X9-DG protein
MPYIEDQNAFTEIDAKNDEWWSQAVNLPLLTKLSSPYMFCPSSPLPKKIVLDGLDNTNPKSPDQPMPMYAAISGATDGNAASPIFRNVIVGARGISSKNGILYPNSSVGGGDVVDGFSNTLLVAEQSDWGNENGRERDIRSTANGGAFICHCDSNPPGPLNFYNYNITTVRYPINDKLWDPVAANGKSDFGRVNKPIQSVHPGGAHALFADGSVQFLNESLDIAILRALAARNDGQVTVF